MRNESMIVAISPAEFGFMLVDNLYLISFTLNVQHAGISSDDLSSHRLPEISRLSDGVHLQSAGATKSLAPSYDAPSSRSSESMSRKETPRLFVVQRRPPARASLTYCRQSAGRPCSN